MWNGQIWLKNSSWNFNISVNFDYFVVKTDHFLVTFNYAISHLQLTIKILEFD